MKKILHFILVAALLVTFLPSVKAASLNWQEAGASIESQWPGDFSSPSFKQSVDNLKAANAKSVALVFRIYQSNLNSTDIAAGGDTPGDADLASAIDYVHSKGMKVMLKPHLESYTGEWRAFINPSDRNTWFANYGNFIKHFAQIGQAHQAESFCVGAELIDMSTSSNNSTNTARWVNLINSVRTVYSGKLTYSANWGSGGFADEKNHIDFWSSLDYIGISAYFNLNTDGSVNSLKAAWDSYNKNDITPLSQKWNKPVVFTEVGYKSVSGAHYEPWNYNRSGSYDGVEQANDYQALFDYWKDYSFMQGALFWEWRSDPNAGGQGDTSYTPQHKPAEATMSQWFSGAGTATPPPGPPPAFTATASVSPTTAAAGQTANINASVTNTGGEAGGIIVDVEIYNSGGQKVLQKYFDNQMFTQGQNKSFPVSWTVAANDAYKVKVGVFNYNWSQNYVWNDSAATFGSSGGSSGGGSSPPPPAGQLDIWWPSSGAMVSGVQPFKGLLENTSLSQYNMYWQVDGGGLVLMNNNNTDYPHKEFDVDLSNWTWKGSGPYTLTFTAKDLSGNILAQRTINITVAH